MTTLKVVMFQLSSIYELNQLVTVRTHEKRLKESLRQANQLTIKAGKALVGQVTTISKEIT